MAKKSAPSRLNIPSIRRMLEGSTASDFKALGHPLADRIIYPEDLGTPAAAHRPDLVAVQVQPCGGQRLKMTSRKFLSGKVR